MRLSASLLASHGSIMRELGCPALVYTADEKRLSVPSSLASLYKGEELISCVRHNGISP